VPGVTASGLALGSRRGGPHGRLPSRGPGWSALVGVALAATWGISPVIALDKARQDAAISCIANAVTTQNARLGLLNETTGTEQAVTVDRFEFGNCTDTGLGELYCFVAYNVSMTGNPLVAMADPQLATPEGRRVVSQWRFTFSDSGTSCQTMN
jgi:hypothetical protein